MISTFNFEEIKEGYFRFYNQAVEKKHNRLPFYDIANWDTVLDPISKTIFSDIRDMGLQLYPIFPVDENAYLHFANPFKRVGIEIVFKNSSLKIIENKLKKLDNEGWTIYKTNSRDTNSPIEEFFRFKRKNTRIEFEDLDDDLKIAFAKKYFQENTHCLLYHIFYEHFQGALK